MAPKRDGFSRLEKLLRAYALDKDKALQSCSWGKYQMMGMNYATAGYSDVFAFVKAMSSSEPAQLKVLVAFIKSNRALRTGMQNKDYRQIAAAYNGSGWESSNPHYATNIETYAREYR